MSGFPPNQLAEALRLIDAGSLPLPDRLSNAGTFLVIEGCVDLDSKSLTDQGRRLLTMLGGGQP